MSSVPIIALTMGDPAGIGPEIIVKAFQDEALPLQSRALVIGDARLLQETAKKYAPEILIHPIKKPEAGSVAARRRVEFFSSGRMQCRGWAASLSREYMSHDLRYK